MVSHYALSSWFLKKLIKLSRNYLNYLKRLAHECSASARLTLGFSLPILGCEASDQYKFNEENMTCDESISLLLTSSAIEFFRAIPMNNKINIIVLSEVYI